MSFEARYHRFSTIKSMSFLSERLYGPLQVKHAVYLMFSIMFVWRGLSTGNTNAIAFAVTIAFLGLLSAVAGTKTLSFEAKLFMIFYSLFDSLFSGSGERARQGRVRSVKVQAHSRGRAKLLPWVAKLKVLAPSLAISVPGASYAVYVVATSGLEIHTKTVLVAVVVLAVAAPHILGLMWGGSRWIP